ncbi:MAG: ATP-binding protein [Candidatus Omnitrophica bacterium]|nr:ATP-binding protein [Candidatus Omnitrophota bacterium]MDD5311363.1 ATP-binding protein [Candidatus Omnitrophota bacterium]MDD5546944.1 ATP-binding protein [Candidatus Omnitrophota bacterium]
MRPERQIFNIDPTDFAFALVKLLAVFGAMIWGLYHPMSPGAKLFFLVIIGIYFVYNLALYLCVFKFADKAPKIYFFELLVDLIFLSVIVPMTGGLNSTFTLGFFLLAAIHSFYYGLFASIGIALLVSGVYIFSCPDCLMKLHWTDISLRAGFLLLLAVTMGYLSERERQMHRQLVNAEQLAAMGLMSSQIAHAVRNPLSTISLNAELLAEQIKKCQGVDAKEAGTLIGSIMNEVQEVNDVVGEHLKFMRKSKSEYKSCDVNALLDSLVKFLEKEASRKGISFLKELEGNLPNAGIEDSQLRQIMLNIMRNSFEAMPSGGQIRVYTKKEKDGVEITVEDTGVGIARENLRRIFEPFFTTKDVGTGLGLYIARDMVITAGGGISCESKVNKGTKVKIRLPFVV